MTRRPTRWGRRRWGFLGALAVALVLGHVVTTALASGTGGNEPFVRSGEVGDTVRLAYADVRVRDVRPAQLLLGPLSDALATRAAGVYVVATVELTPTREPTVFRTTQLVDPAGRAYLPSVRSECLTPPSSTTLVTTYAMLCFDVPPDRLAGLRLQVARGSEITDSLRHDDLAEIDLGVSAADEREWARTTAAYDVVQPTIEPFVPQPADIVVAPEPDTPEGDS